MPLHFRSVRVLIQAIPLCVTLTFSAPGTEFQPAETIVSPSPAEARSLKAGSGRSFTDLDVAAWGPEAALIQEEAGGGQQILLWNIASGATRSWPVPSGYRAKSLAWHPIERALFLLAQRKDSSYILRVAEGHGGWQAQTVYGSSKNLRRLVVGPRPFQGDSGTYYRLFLGEEYPAGKFATLSLNEKGRFPYYAISAPGVKNPENDMGVPASSVSAASSLPMAFHPAGHIFLWENPDHCFEAMDYYNNWGHESRPLEASKLCRGSVTVTPNGLGLLHWLPGVAGVELRLEGGKRVQRLAGGIRFAFTPSSVPDGLGLVGVVKSAAGYQVQYVPVKVPLPDVVNAWMFAETPDDVAHLAKSGGVYRSTLFSQMYNLYDTEAYSCGSYDTGIPTRPYLVTTDALWEVFAAAYEGLFVTVEKQKAMPAFWEFIRLAASDFRTQAPGSVPGRVFAVLDAYRSGKLDATGEAGRIEAAIGSFPSPALDTEVDYSALKPRGNYASSPAFQRYFKAFTYLTRSAGPKLAGDPTLKSLSAAPRTLASVWIGAYRPFISAGRNELVWDTLAFVPPTYLKHSPGGKALFPLSWGWDNEILNSVVQHETWPPGEQVGRYMASALDLPAAMGNPLAQRLSTPEHARYPKLAAVMADLSSRRWRQARDSLNLYQSWLAALQTQWGQVSGYPSPARDWALWGGKRLQTGLASWATLRHATVLVNDQSAAECGEGGFEELGLRAPRGYVEPDTATFLALADLFDKARTNLGAELALKGSAKLDPYGAQEPFQKGLQSRLAASADAARRFAAMAAKELRGRSLDDSEYESIREFGRVAEHHFLLYKSLSNEGLGLPVPDPIPKIADVAKGTDGKSKLYAAVGHPLEWDQIVPYFGRREAVKGAVYSYYELVSDSLFNDKEWQASMSHRTRPAWVAPDVLERNLACPARSQF